MKIAVYTIALNEQQFVERWYNSAKQADFLLIADTGSTDMTVKYAKNLGINVIKIAIKPWRFDDARNAALARIPENIDYCIALDMDEILIDGWREKLEAVDPSVTRPRYKYTWSWKDDGTEGLTYGDDITEGLPFVLSNPAGSTSYTATGYAYDIAIAGLPFFISPLDDSPYRRVTAQYRKQQIDQSREPGEQSLTGWWIRSQSSFHLGQGIKNS